MRKVNFPRLLAQLPFLPFLVLLASLTSEFLKDQFDALLPQSFVDWKEENTIEFLIILLLLWWACNSTIGWWHCRSKLMNLKGEGSEKIFDMSASDAAEYVMENLEMNIVQANDFLTQMAIEERVHIRAIKVGESTNSPVPHGVFEDYEMFLIGDEKQRDQAQAFGCAFSEKGWIVKKITQQLDDQLLYDAPRFISKDLADVCSWYKQSSPKLP